MLIYGTIIWLLLIGILTWRDEKRRLVYLAMALPTYLIRLKVFNIPTTWLELAIYVVVALWVIKIIWRRQRNKWWQSLTAYKYPLLLMAVGLIMGTAISLDLTRSLGIIKGWFFDPLLLFILITNTDHADHPKIEFNNVVFGLWLSGVVLAGAAIGQVITGHFATLDQRASAWFGSANYLALYLIPIMILVLGWWKEIKRGYSQWIVSVGWLMMLVALYFTYSYAGWLALFVAVAGLIWVVSKNKPWLLGVGLALAVFVVSQWHLPKFQQMLDLVGRSSTHVRLQVWQTSLLMIKEHWLTGIGLGLFEQRYPEFANRLFRPPLELVMLHAHNLFLYFWINTGLIGLIGFLGILGIFFIQIAQTWRARHDLIVASVGAAMLAILVHGLLDTPYWKNDLAAVFWMVVALGAILNREACGGKNLSNRY